jgi:hypothetical protein
MTTWVRFGTAGNRIGGEIQDWPGYDLETEPVLAASLGRKQP